MTLVQEPDIQRFVFDDADWTFYEDVCRRLERRRAFVTYYKGKLEVVTTSFLHERIAFLLHTIVKVLAEESNTSIITAGRATLRDPALDEGTEPDTSFYTQNAARMRNHRQINLPADPPPDLAIEVEVTRRLGERRLIYRDIGVPELWRYADGELIVLLRRADDYERTDRSPTFPQLAPDEIARFVEAGISADETPWTRDFRRHVQAVLGNRADRGA